MNNKSKPIEHGYFDATSVFKQYHKDFKGWKINHYTDNIEVITLTQQLNKPIIACAGRYGFTQLPIELKEHFITWITTITLTQG